MSASYEVFSVKSHKSFVPVLEKLDAFHRQPCTCVELNRNRILNSVFFSMFQLGKSGTTSTAKAVLSGGIAAGNSGTVLALN